MLITHAAAPPRRRVRSFPTAPQAPTRFVLPARLEARTPAEARGLARDQVRLLVSWVASGTLVHSRFDRLQDFLRAGDLLVVNDSATLPAALSARRADGSQVVLHLSTPHPAFRGGWIVEPRHTTVRPGEVLALAEGGSAHLLEPLAGSTRLWTARLDLPSRVLDFLQRNGRPIRYGYLRENWPLSTYQTMFSRRPGSAEMPSAGRPFTPAVVASLRAKGVNLASITLHTGVSSLENHERPYAEFFVVPAATARAINHTRQRGGRVIAVGTTVVRAIESLPRVAGEIEGHPRGVRSAVESSLRPRKRVPLSHAGNIRAGRGWTRLMITPQRGIWGVDGILTGFHEPRATHLSMLEALAGRAHLAQAYQAALDDGYLWHEFGDVHLILR